MFSLKGYEFLLENTHTVQKLLAINLPKNQGMSCEGACAHAHVRSAVARVRAKSILESVRDVRACGPFLGVRCAITLLHTFCLKN